MDKNTHNLTLQIGIVSLFAFLGLVWQGCKPKPLPLVEKVIVNGAMKQLMEDGILTNTVDLDTIKDKMHLFGLGPAENLQGEVIIVDGKSYKAKAINDSMVNIEETFKIKAPFFAYTHITEWDTLPLPRHIAKIKDLEQYLNYLTQSTKRSFIFKITGVVKKADIHLTYLPKDKKINNIQDVHESKTRYQLNYEDVIIIGFFSIDDKYVFTYSDSYIHMHLINANRTIAGHLDDVVFNPEKMTIFLPKKGL